jgi:hypothetical protein
MAPAAEWEARLVDSGQDSRKRPEPEKQDQRDGDEAAHFARWSMTIMPLDEKLDNA